MQKIDTSEIKQFLLSKVQFKMIPMDTCECGKLPVAGMLNKEGEKVYMKDHRGHEIKLCVECDKLKMGDKEKRDSFQAYKSIEFDEKRREKIGIGWGIPIATRDLNKYKYREDEPDKVELIQDESHIL